MPFSQAMCRTNEVLGIGLEYGKLKDDDVGLSGGHSTGEVLYGWMRILLAPGA
jgi:hypothetical protein